MNKLLISIICTSLVFQTSFVFGQEVGSEATSAFDQLLKDLTTGSSQQEQEVPLDSLDDFEIDTSINDEETEVIVDGVEPTSAANDEDTILRDSTEEAIRAAISQVQEERARELQDYQVRMDSYDNGFFDYIKYNELRDAARHDKNILGTSKKILEDLAANTYKYTQDEDVKFYLKNDVTEVSAIGPKGRVVRLDTGKTRFDIDPQNTRAERRENVVISISYERVVDVTEAFEAGRTDAIFDMDLLLFIHSKNENTESQRYFKKLSLNVDWINKTGDLPTITILNRGDKIALEDTDFEVRTELKSLKTILLDRKHGITRVFPTTAGAIDARADFGGETNSMSLMLPGFSGRFKNFEMRDSVLVKSNVWKDGRNTSSRVTPGYYKGRPFLGIIDRSSVNDLVLDNNDNYVLKPGVTSTNYDGGYREVGYHYQITDYDILKRDENGDLVLDENGRSIVIGKAKLKRTFDSHGCLRLQDHDLYLLNDVLNFGPKDKIPVEVKMNFNGAFAEIDSIFTKSSGYKKVVYSTKPISSHETVTCRSGSTYQVRQFNRNTIHTIADKDCLSQTFQARGENATLENLVNFINGNGRPPSTRNLGNVAHPAIAYPYLRENLQAVKASYPNFDIDKGDQDSIIAALDIYNEMVVNTTPSVQGVLNNILQNSGVSNPEIWPALTRVRRSRAINKNLDNYNLHCLNRVKGFEVLDGNGRPVTSYVNFCRDVYNDLINGGGARLTR